MQSYFTPEYILQKFSHHEFNYDYSIIIISYRSHSMECIRNDAMWYKRMLSSNAWSTNGADRRVKLCRGYIE